MRTSVHSLIALALSGCISAAPTSSALPSAQQSRLGGALPSSGTPTTLLYITASGTSRLRSYDWATLAPVRKVRVWDGPTGLCVDKKGAIFVADADRSKIVEFRHGGKKPIATLPDSGFTPQTCAIDPTTGDLAVTNHTGGSGTGNLIIFPHARGEARAYTIPTLTKYNACAYDSSGNLVLNGTNGSSQVGFAILPHGKSKLESLKIDQQIPYPNGIQWDGAHWAIGNGSTIYQVDVHGKSGTTVGTTRLSSNGPIAQFSIYQGSIVVPEIIAGQVQIFAYPAGGTASSTISGLDLPAGTAVSAAK